MDKKSKLSRLYKKMKEDKSLPLRKGANNLVFGEGDPNANIVFIGEGPGYWEDQKARPFVGNAGAFLNQLLQSIGILRKEVFITNVVNYRPPNNRDPTPSEIKAFQPYIDKMIEIINPKIIVTLGRFSMAKFIPNVKISRVHGNIHNVDWEGRQLVVVPMYHPAAALRSSGIKQQAIIDFQKLPEILKESKKVKIQQMQLT
jgi:DNA polymerase